MKRAVLCVKNPQDYISQLDDYSIMIVNPDSPPARLEYLLDRSDWSLLITQHKHEFRDGADYDNERLFWYTSGTTGDSKFYSFTQQQLDSKIKTIVDCYDITEKDRYVSVMPLWHAHGQGFYWATKHIGCETHFLSGHQIKELPKLSPTFVTAIPDFLKLVVRLDLSNMRFIRSASSPLSDSLYLGLKEKFKIPIIEAFGMTEALSHCFTNPLYGEQKMGTVGLPSGIEAMISDNDRLHIRGESVFTDQWFDTGDLARCDEDGYYRILGRSQDRINVRGYKLDPVSIESQLKSKDPNIEECVIFGKEEVNCIFTGPIDKKQVIDYLVDIHPFCRPRWIERFDQIPVPPSGKVSRSWLLKQVSDK